MWCPQIGPLNSILYDISYSDGHLEVQAMSPNTQQWEIYYNMHSMKLTFYTKNTSLLNLSAFWMK